MTAPDRSGALIALDWGTSSLRAWLLDGTGRAIERRAAPQGIMRIEPGGFPAAFDAIAAGWGSLPAIAAGMVGSAQGWVEAPYVPCPAGPEDLARRLVAVEGRALHIVPGVIQHRPLPDVMRGEETQVAGALSLRPELAEGEHLVVLPGTHSKWARLVDGRIRAFATCMTGELFAVLRDHSILGRLARPGPPDEAAFLRGVSAAQAGTGIAPLLFSARSLVLAGEMRPEASLDYLSGLLIGEELRVAPGAPTLMIGEPGLCGRYRLAFAHLGMGAVPEIEDAAVAGLWRIAVAAGLTAQEGPIP